VFPNIPRAMIQQGPEGQRPVAVLIFFLRADGAPHQTGQAALQSNRFSGNQFGHLLAGQSFGTITVKPARAVILSLKCLDLAEERIS